MKVQLDRAQVYQATAQVDLGDGISVCEALAVVHGILDKLQGTLSAWKPWTKVPVAIALAVVSSIRGHMCEVGQ